MTKLEFMYAAYLAALPAVTERVLKENFPKTKNEKIAETIANLTEQIAYYSYKDTAEHWIDDINEK